MNPIKWEDIKVGQDYFTEYTPQKKYTKLADMRIRGHRGDDTYSDFDIETIARCNHYLWEDRIKFKSGCKHCEWIEKLFSNDKIESNREYWLVTEIFVYLHNGKDYCDGGK